MERKIAALQGRGTRVEVQFTVSDELVGKIPENATLFVIVKGIDNGMPMPAAVIKQPYAQVTQPVQLSEANAMLADYTLSQLDKAEVIVRISSAADAMAQVGDLEGRAQISVSAGKLVEVTINVDSEVTP